MARKRGEYQKRKERQDKVTSIIVVLFFFVGTVLMLYGLVQETVNVYDIDHNTLNTYTGEYKYRLKVSYGRHRRSSYIFTLGNGDIVLASKREVDHQELLDDNEVLTFQYTTMFSNPLYGRYSAVSIKTTDGEATIVDIGRSRRDSVTGIWACSIVVVLCCGLLVGLFIMSYYAGDWKRRYQKWRKKRRKMREQIESSK